MFRSLLLRAAALCVTGLVFADTRAAAQVTTIPVSSLPANSRLAICGDSITEQMMYTKYVEIYLRACAGRPDISCFQFGWGGESASTLPNRINRGDLDAFVPTAATYLYGANDAGGMAWDPGWMTTMWTGRNNDILNTLAAKYSGIGARTVMCSPTYFDLNSSGTDPTVSNDTLSHLRDISLSMAQGNGKGFADIRQRMMESGLAARTALGSNFRFGGSDGVHAGPNGHLMMAHEILKALNCDGAIATINVNMSGATTASTGHTIVSSSGGVVTVDSTRYPFCYNYNGSTATDRMSTILPFLPFSQNLNRFTLVVTNLGAANANVTWGNATLTFTSAQLAAGVNLAEQFANTPFDSAFANVMNLIETKQIKERDMIKAAGSVTASTKGWTAADVTARNQMDADVVGAITTVRHTISIVPTGGGTAPVITGATTTSGTVGSAFSFQITAANSPTSYGASGLPAGLSVNTSTGLISGTPATSGTSNVTLSATNAFGTGTRGLTVTVSAGTPVPVITSSGTANGTVGTSFSYQITATNNPTIYYATGLPSGLSLNASTGLISGTPSADATTNVLLSAQNAGGNGPTVNLAITVGSGGGGGSNIVATNFVSGGSNQTLNGTQTGLTANLPGGSWVWGGGWNWAGPIVASTGYGAPQNCVWLSEESTALGISLSSSGGYTKPAQMRISARVGVDTAYANGAGLGFWSSMPARTDGASSLAGFTGLILQPGGSLQLYVSGTATGSAVSVGTINTKTLYQLTYDVNTSTGAISNIAFNGAAVSGISSSGFTNSATAFAGVLSRVQARAFAAGITLASIGGGGSAPAITSATSASGTVGSSFTYQITASNSPTSYGASGLPSGLSVSTSTGAITGAPAAAGTSTVTLSATNANGTGTATLTLTISAAGSAPSITSPSSATGTVGSAFSYQITASNSPTSYGASGLPSGLSVSTSTGAISGTPSATGTSSITISATNANGTGSATLTLTVNAAGSAPAITSGTTASGTVGSAFSYQITASNSPTSYNASGLPSGLTVNTSTGAITGTPTSAGSSSVTISATNAYGTGSATLVITIGASGSSDIIATSFSSTASAQTLNGAATGISTNLPGSTWVWGAGWNWGSPIIPATSYGSPLNSAWLSEEKTALGVSIASAGSYAKPTQIRVSAEIALDTARANGGALGFWSSMPARSDSASSLTGFTGLNLQPNGSLQLYVNGVATGSPVGSASLSAWTFYALSFDVDTSAGAISNIVFNGSSVTGISSTGFTNAATAYAGVLSCSSARVDFKNFKVMSIGGGGGGGGGTNIVSSTFASGGSNQAVNTTQTGLTTNSPGGSWVWGAGWNWGAPYVPGVSSSSPLNCIWLVEEKTALGLSLASAGGYTKPSHISISADIAVETARANGGGLGFWSSMPVRSDSASSLTGFTGLCVQPNGSIQLYVNGVSSGAPVSTAALSNLTFYTLSYQVDTATGAISNILFNGSTVNGISSTGFTNGATAFGGVLSLSSARTNFKNLSISSW